MQIPAWLDQPPEAWPQAQRDLLDERVAIKRFCGAIPLSEAEAQALAEERERITQACAATT